MAAESVSANRGRTNQGIRQGVISLQKGRTRPLASLLLFCTCIALLLVLTSVASTASGRNRPVGPLLSLHDALRGPLQPGQRPNFPCETCPGSSMVATNQLPGPDPHVNVTPNADASQELEPCSAPVLGQNRIAFISNGEDTDGDGLIDPAFPTELGFIPDFDIWLMRPDGTQQQKVIDLPGEQHDPAYDPGGRLLAFSSNVSGTYQIYTVEVNTGVVQQITTSTGDKRHPTWSADSNWLAFSVNRTGNWDIYKIPSNAAGTEVALATTSANEQHPAWSPTASFIAYQAVVGGHERILLMDTEGGNVSVLSNAGSDTNGDDIQPAWSPNGQSIIFASSRSQGAGDAINDYNIFIMSSAGEVVTTDAALITSTDITDQYDETYPTWTPDLDARARSRFIYQANRPGAGGGAAEPDLWATFYQDTVPPALVEAPDRDTALPWVDNRNPAPGADVVIKVAVYDRDTGVNSVAALLKDPDLKVYDWWGAQFETAVSGQQAIERDAAIVGSCPMYDDGVAPDQTADDGIYTGTFTTSTVARDYIIDIAVTDGVNSMIYDDIYGFSTVTFNPNDRILFVDDYCEGQAFINLTGWNNDLFASYPLESYWRLNPGYADGYEGTTDFDSIAGPLDEGYDVWRILCRGPIPATILSNYLPTSEFQLDPDQASSNPTGAQADREVLVANRAILWAAPHTGDLWIADGTIQDAATQARLGHFLDEGGRLFIAGEDIAWALTMGGQSANNFLTNYLRANYLADASGTYGFSVTGDTGSPVAYDAWVLSGLSHVSAISNWYEVADNPLALVTPRVPVNPVACYCDAADHGSGSVHADGITPLDVASKLYGYGGFDGTAAGTSYENTQTGARLAYLAFGFEDIHRTYIPAHASIPQHCANHRSHLLHNFLCWARTGAFQGRVVSISEGGQPVTDPEPVVIATQGSLRYAVRCEKDGTFVMQGLRSGSYRIMAMRTGYEIDHSDGAWVHGGSNAVQIDFAIKEAQPGAIAGTVTSEGSGGFVSGVRVRAYLIPPSSVEETELLTSEVKSEQVADEVVIDDPDAYIAEGYSAADGTFVLSDIAAGDYVVIADGTEVGYGSQQLQVTVTPGNTSNLAFVLGAADGTLEVQVVSAEDSAAIENATVEVRDTDEALVASGTTDSTGGVSVTLPGGTYLVRASAAGYETSAAQNVGITSAGTSSLTITLSTVPPGSLSGQVTSATTGQPISGIVMRVLSGDTVIASTVTSDTLTVPGDGTAAYNYHFDSIPAGNVTVRPVVSGYNPVPAERQITINTGAVTDQVDFSLESLHVFPAGLQLMSLPWNYPNSDPSVLLNVNPLDLQMATWENSSARYRLYPNAPSDRFRLGTGYWLQLTSAADIAQQGVSAESVFEIDLHAGWNLIGTPFNQPLDFYAVQVRDANGVVRSLQDALARNIVSSSLFAYTLGGYRTVATMVPYVGYWIAAGESCSLLVDKTTATLAVSGQSSRTAVTAPDGGWLLQLRTTAAGMEDQATYIGTAAVASDAYDPGIDQAKPPVPVSASYVYSAIVNRGQAMAVDVKGENGGAAKWELDVATNAVGEIVELSWPELEAIPSSVRPVLTDVVTGKAVYMRTNMSYKFESDGSTRHFEISIEPDGAGQLSIGSATATAVHGNVVVSYSLSKSADVSVEIRNISGVIVQRVISGETQTSGVRSVQWNGRNAGGAIVPNGAYLVFITAATEDGQLANALARVNFRK